MQSLKRSMPAWLTGRRLVIGLPYAWFLILAFLPVLIVLKISLSEMQTTAVSGMVSWQGAWPSIQLDISSYLFLASDELYLATYLSSIRFALYTTVICLGLGYPFAYFMARAPKQWAQRTKAQ